MKKLIFILFLAVAISGFSQSKNEWVASFEEASNLSKGTDKPILLFFSGSDWCKPCIRLKSYIFETDDFAEYAQKFVLYNADFPYRKKLSEDTIKQNEKLAEKYNPEGSFPKVVYLSAEEKVLGTTGYIDCSPLEYIEEIKSLVHF